MPTYSSWSANSTARLNLHNDRSRRTIYVRMSGIWLEQDMGVAIDAFLQASAEYRDVPHFVLSDVRGMTLASNAAARQFGQSIFQARLRGVVLCVHLSDSTLMRLQAGRLARENSPGDDVTINVVSPEEAERVLEQARLLHPAVTPARVRVTSE